MKIENKEKAKLLKLAELSFTLDVAAWFLEIDIKDLELYRDEYESKLPPDYFKVRLKRFSKMFGYNVKLQVMRYLQPRTSKQKITDSFRANIYHHLKKKTGKTFDKVGYTINELMAHLEKNFKPGMSWDNYGTDWHIDHRVPVSWFNYEDDNSTEFIKCWGLNNLQPKEAKENMSKGNRYAD